MQMRIEENKETNQTNSYSYIGLKIKKYITLIIPIIIHQHQIQIIHCLSHNTYLKIIIHIKHIHNKIIKKNMKKVVI